MCHSFIYFDYEKKASFELLNVLLQCNARKSLSTSMVRSKLIYFVIVLNILLDFQARTYFISQSS